LSLGFVLLPAGQRFRDRVEEDHAPGHVGGNDRVADAGQSDPQTLMLRDQVFLSFSASSNFLL